MLVKRHNGTSMALLVLNFLRNCRSTDRQLNKYKHVHMAMNLYGIFLTVNQETISSVSLLQKRLT